MSRISSEGLPPYSYVPGGKWPHPTRSPDGHLWGRAQQPVAPILDGNWRDSPAYLRGFALFNAGYYWEAHEAWEALWHAHGRSGPTAWIVQALIKLAAAGVKIRERRPDGARTHAARAADLLERANRAGGRIQLGLDLDTIADAARAVASHPPCDGSPKDAPVARVFPFGIEPRVRGEDHGTAGEPPGDRACIEPASADIDDREIRGPRTIDGARSILELE